MCGFVCTNKDLEYSKSNKKIKSRGPDFTNSVKLDKFNIVHNLLDISGLKILQPITKDNITIFFNGEIYEPYNEVESKTIIPLYKEYGEKFIEKINGEYALVIIDHSKQLILAYSDIFATKPLFYSVNGDDIGISSYKSELDILKFKEIKRIKPSTYVKINLKNNEYSESIHSNFNLEEKNNSYNSCIDALSNAFKIRCNKPAGVGLSSGHDSGGILKWSVNNKNKNSFFFVETDNEDLSVMQERYKICENNKLPLHLIDYKKNLTLNEIMEHKLLELKMEEYELFKNEVSTTLISKLLRTVKAKKLNVFISGQGSDEILSNYKSGPFVKNLQKQFPWKNFYEGANRHFIDQLEYIGGCYGIETRYPYLDKNFVQEFLWLSKEKKNEKYKNVLSEYLNDLSVSDIKYGFRINNINANV